MWGSFVCFTHTARIIVQSCNLTLVQSFHAIVQSPHTKIFIHHHQEGPMLPPTFKGSNTDVRTKWKELNRLQELLSSWPPTATLTFERSYIQIRNYMKTKPLKHNFGQLDVIDCCIKCFINCKKISRNPTFLFWARSCNISSALMWISMKILRRKNANVRQSTRSTQEN